MSETTLNWHRVCGAEEIEREDLVQFEHAGRVYAIYHTPSGFYASDGICTHEEAYLADGMVIGEIIECPIHQGQFHIPSGKAKGAPVCVDLRTYPVKIEADAIYLGLPD